MNILIVEDEPIVVMMYRGVLQWKGYTIVGTASSGMEAIELAQLKNPDLIIMDITLQGDITGVDAARTIRETSDVPIIYVTANTDDRTKEMAMETFPVAYLKKPVNITEVLLYIQRVFKGAHNISYPVLS